MSRHSNKIPWNCKVNFRETKREGALGCKVRRGLLKKSVRMPWGVRRDSLKEIEKMTWVRDVCVAKKRGFWSTKKI